MMKCCIEENVRGLIVFTRHAWRVYLNSKKFQMIFFNVSFLYSHKKNFHSPIINNPSEISINWSLENASNTPKNFSQNLRSYKIVRCLQHEHLFQEWDDEEGADNFLFTSRWGGRGSTIPPGSPPFPCLLPPLR